MSLLDSLTEHFSRNLWSILPFTACFLLAFFFPLSFKSMSDYLWAYVRTSASERVHGNTVWLNAVGKRRKLRNKYVGSRWPQATSHKVKVHDHPNHSPIAKTKKAKKLFNFVR